MIQTFYLDVSKYQNKRLKRGDEIDYMARAPSSFWNTIMQESWYVDFPQCNKPKAEKNRAYYLHHKIDLGENAEEDEDDDQKLSYHA